MDRQGEIEIYVRDCDVADVLAWVESRLGVLSGPEEAGDATVYHSPSGPLIVTPAIEHGPFVGLWFNTSRTPWRSDVDCGE